MKNENEIAVARYVQLCRMWGEWEDQGRWVYIKGRPEYWPARREIAAKCEVLRKRTGRHGAHIRTPRGGDFAIASTAGI
jgi:hypothetical protein